MLLILTLYLVKKVNNIPILIVFSVISTCKLFTLR